MLTSEKMAILQAMRELSGGEALFRPSALSRSIECPGSVLAGLRSATRKRSSPAAREGTAAHFVASEVLEGKRQLVEWADRMVRLETDPGPDIHCDEEMVASLEMYVDYIASRITPTTTMLIEQKLTLATLDPEDPLFGENKGTADCVLIDMEARSIEIVDLKYGKGVMVKGDSAQLKDYCLLGLITYAPPAGGWATARTTIVQPRAFKEEEQIKPVDHDPNTLMIDFLGTLVTTMEEALDPNARLSPGDHCMFCDAKPTCPALRDQAININRDMFAKVPMMTASSELEPLPTKLFIGGKPKEEADPGTVLLPTAQNLDPGDVATILIRRTVYDAWIKSIEQYAVQLLEGGVKVPGWKLVARSGNRAWKTPDESGRPVASILKEITGSETAIWTKPKLKSPAQIEKMLPPAKRPLIADLVFRPTGAPTLVQESDTRPTTPSLLGPIAKENQ